MNFTGTTGTLTDLYGAVTYRIQVAVVVILNGQEVIGDRSNAINMTTIEGGEYIVFVLYNTYITDMSLMLFSHLTSYMSRSG